MVRELDKRVETYMMKFVMCFAGVLFGSVMNAQPIDNSIAEDTIMEDENYSSDQPIDIERESSEELLSVETPPPFNISVLIDGMVAPTEILRMYSLNLFC